MVPVLQAAPRAGMVTITTEEPAQVRYRGNCRHFYFNEHKVQDFVLNLGFIFLQTIYLRTLKFNADMDIILFNN